MTWSADEMNEPAVIIHHAAEIPADWGELRPAVRKTTVAIREPNGIETFTLSWGTLTAVPGVDWVIVQDDGEAYPIKRDIFAQTYEGVAPGRYRKAARSRLVQVPPGVLACVASPEGELLVRHPDYVAIGAAGEVYANAADWVAENLSFE